MDISNTSATQLGAAVQVAIQKQMLDALKTQGGSELQLLASAAPQPSVNAPSQGHFVDALA